MDAIEFFNLLYADKTPDSHILIYTLPDKKSNWFTDLAQAVSFTSTIKAKNVYFGVGLSPQAYGISDRCKADDIVAIPGVWVDIDILGPGHKKRNLPATMEIALQLLKNCELEPSAVIHTGGGLQAYWAFDKLWWLNDEPSRAQAVALTERWQAWVKIVAKDLGLNNIGQPYDIDSTHDLARVLRVPGTFNCKAAPKRPVMLAELRTDYTYWPSQLNEFLDSHTVRLAPPKPKAPPSDVIKNTAGPLVLSATANPDFNSFMAMYNDAEDKRFRQSYDHKRKDLTDQSASSYDLSLATLAYNAEWSEQEIVNLLIAHRRQHGDDLKINRPDYYERTISRAKLGLVVNNPDLQPQPGPQGDEPPEPAVTVDEKKEILADVSKALGVNITGWVKLMTDPVKYIIEIDGYRVTVGDSGAVLSQRIFNQAIHTACDIGLPLMKPAQWVKLVNKLGQVKEIEHPDITETPAGFCKYWLAKYFNDKPVSDDPAEAVAATLPFTIDSQRYFFLEDFKQFLRLYGVGLKNYSQALREAGCEIRSKTIKVPSGGWVCRSVWQVGDLD